MVDPLDRLAARLRGDAPQALALMYHAVERADGQALSEDYTVSATLFQRHLLALERAGVASIPQAALLAGALPRSPGVLITFDDGFESVLTRAAEPLGDAGWSGLVFVTTDLIGKPGYLDPDQLRVLLGMGLVVGAHGHTHRYLTDLPLDALRDELRRPRRILEALVGYPVTMLSAPGGRLDARVMEEARLAGYRHIFGSRPGFLHDVPAEEPLPRLAVTERTSPELIEQLALGAQAPMLAELARYQALAVPKRVLGNAGYDLARKTVLDVLRRRKGTS